MKKVSLFSKWILSLLCTVGFYANLQSQQTTDNQRQLETAVQKIKDTFTMNNPQVASTPSQTVAQPMAHQMGKVRIGGMDISFLKWFISVVLVLVLLSLLVSFLRKSLYGTKPKVHRKKGHQQLSDVVEYEIEYEEELTYEKNKNKNGKKGDYDE